jgi:prevent-host-death family protein
MDLNMGHNMVMIQVNVFEMKAKLSEYLDRAARGERIIVCRHNKPVAELRPLEQTRREPRPIGPLPGETPFEVPPSFFEPLTDDELDLWEGVPSNDPLSDWRKADAKTRRVAQGRLEYGKRPRAPRQGSGRPDQSSKGGSRRPPRS